MKILAFFLFGAIASAQQSPTHFKTDIDFGNGTVFSTFVDIRFADDQFTITSPRDADVRAMGGKAKLGRIMGKSPKKGIIITIAGQHKKDSLFGETNIPMVGKLKFKGAVEGETLSGEFLSDTTFIGTLRGVSSSENKINYAHLYPLIVKTVQDNIYSKDALQNKEWSNFKGKIKKLCNTAQDDIEIFLGFNILSQQLPFSHLSLSIFSIDEMQSDETTSTRQSVVFEEKNNTTAYLQIKNFSSSQKELAAILPKIVGNAAYKNLIIDLRDNGGGGIDSAFELAKYITTDNMEVGYFVTNKLQYSGYQSELFRTLPSLQPKSTKEFGNELRTTPGVKLIFRKPTNTVFTGDIYVLANGRTASTCEPLIYALKENKKAVIIGEKTYGGMLAASPYAASGKYIVMVPIADFYTYDGVRLDRVGVSPDVEVKSEDALEKALALIDGKVN